MHQVQSLVVPFAVVNFPIGQYVHTLTPAAELYRPGSHAVQVENPVEDVYTPEAHAAHTAEEIPPAMVV